MSLNFPDNNPQSLLCLLSKGGFGRSLNLPARQRLELDVKPQLSQP